MRISHDWSAAFYPRLMETHLKRGYVENSRLFICPRTKRIATMFECRQSSFFPCSALVMIQAIIPRPAITTSLAIV